jgi:hypothetical protein
VFACHVYTIQVSNGNESDRAEDQYYHTYTTEYGGGKTMHTVIIIGYADYA